MGTAMATATGQAMAQTRLIDLPAQPRSLTGTGLFGYGKDDRNRRGPLMSGRMAPRRRAPNGSARCRSCHEIAPHAALAGDRRCETCRGQQDPGGTICKVCSNCYHRLVHDCHGCGHSPQPLPALRSTDFLAPRGERAPAKGPR